MEKVTNRFGQCFYIKPHGDGVLAGRLIDGVEQEGTEYPTAEKAREAVLGFTESTL